MKISKLELAVAGWLAFANVVAHSYYIIYFSFLDTPKSTLTSSHIFYETITVLISETIIALVLIYLLLMFEKLLKNKLEIYTASQVLRAIIAIKLAILLISYLVTIAVIYVRHNDLENRLQPEVGALMVLALLVISLNYGYILLKIALGLVSIMLWSKLKTLKCNLPGLRTFANVLLISGVLYALSGLLHRFGHGLSAFADILISLTLGVLFFVAAKDTEKPGTEAQSAPMSL